MSKQRQMARAMRAAQGQSHAVEIGEHVFVFRLLKRMQVQEARYRILPPLLRITNVLLPALGGFAKLKTKNFDIFDFLENQADLPKLAEAIEKYDWEKLEQLMGFYLDEVEIDGVQYGKLKDHSFFDSDPWLLLKALWKAIEVNNPFLKGITKKKDDGSDDLNPKNPIPTSG